MQLQLNLISKIQSILLVSLLSPVTSIATESDLFDMELEQLIGIEFTVASNIVTDARKQPVSVTTISSNKIAHSGARTLNELLTILVPGFFMVEDQDDSIAGFRGLVADNNSKVMLLLNGTNLNTEWFWGPADAILNGMDLDYIERIEVIRGPGSVTLGQGALLGVINIVTKQSSQSGSLFSISRGPDGLAKQHMSISYVDDDTKAQLYISDGKFDSLPMRNEGWVAGKDEQGLTIYQRQHHLKRNEYTHLIGTLSYGGFEASAFHFDHQRDLYNFYRDREVVSQRLLGATAGYQFDVSKSVNIKLSGHYMLDDYGLLSHGGNITSSSRVEYERTTFAGYAENIPGLADEFVERGQVMGGTRERRKGIMALLNWEEPIKDHKIAFGFEYNVFESGLTDRRGNNFIINEDIQLLGLSSDGSGGFIAGGNLNENNTWVKSDRFSMQSLLFEDFWNINESFDMFLAMRWDDHPNWGSHISPRIAALYQVNRNSMVRLAWQTGFRGAVGVQFAGGFVQDGFLSEQNFDDVNAIATTYADFNFNGDATDDTGQLNSVEPETIESIELEYSYATDTLRFNGVIFHNTVEDIITAQAHGYVGIGFGNQVGSDDIGTWNGHWYYQNQSGKLKQLGTELEIEYQFDAWVLSASHANVSITSADAGTIGVYTLPGKKTAVYPENVTRLGLQYSNEFSIGDLSWSLFHLYYWNYYSPTAIKVDGSHIVNTAASFNPKSIPGLTLTLTLKNVLDADGLYPINSTGDASNTIGTPSIESRTWWLGFNYAF